jgi:hypothetical protein
VDILLRKRHDSALKRSRIRYTQERRRKASRSLSGPAVCAVGVCAWKWCNAGRAGPDTYLDYVDASHWRERMGVDLCVLPPCPANPRYPRCTTYIYKMRQQASKPHAGDVILGPTKGTYVSTCLLLMGSTRLHSGLAKLKPSIGHGTASTTTLWRRKGLKQSQEARSLQPPSVVGRPDLSSLP